MSSNRILFYTTDNDEQTEFLGSRLGLILEPGDVVFLTGDLGAGKTHFTSGIVRTSCGEGNYVTSPTFTIVNEYSGNGINLFHFDIYRLSSLDELIDIGLEDYLDRNGILVFEWADIIPELDRLPGRHFSVRIIRRDDISPDYREISISGPLGDDFCADSCN